MKNLLRLVFVCAGLCLLLAIGVTACVVRVANDGDWSAGFGSGNSSSKAERTETHALEFPAGGELHIEIAAGDVRVRSSETDAPSLVAHITAYGKDEARAKEWLDKTKLEIASSSSGVRIGSRVEGAQPRTRSAIDLELVVPARARLSIDTGSGGIRAEGAGFGDARLNSSYGAIAIALVRGDLTATSGSGEVDVRDVQGARCEIRSDYGDLNVERIAADELTAVTGSGSIKARALHANRAKLDSGYGDLELSDLEGELTAKSSSGSIRAARLSGGSYALISDYGSIEVSGADGSLEAKTSSGDLKLADCGGAVVADTEYGSVHVAGVLTSLSARTSSGSMSIAALAGSQLASDWKIVSSYGDVRCELPAEIAFDLSASTEYGEVDLGYDIAIAAGASLSGKRLEGRVNGGGHRLVVATSSGDVAIAPLAR